MLNKYCNIMNALDSAGDYGDNIYDVAVTYAISNSLSNPYFPLDKKQAEKDKLWLHDAMQNLIIMVLNTDPAMNGEVQQELKAQLEKLIADEQIEKSQAVKEIAQKIVIKMTELIANVAMNMSTIQLGFQNLGKLAGFKAATALVNNGINRLTPKSRAGLATMKGCVILVVVSRSNSSEIPPSPASISMSLFSGVDRLH